jgi:hypothetical protein
MFKRCTICLISLGVLPILFGGCASNYPPTAIIGTWQTGLKDKKATMTFWENGVWSYEKRGQIQTGTFKFLNDKELEIKLDGPANEQHPTIYKRTVSFAHHDQMHLMDYDTGMRTTWKRTEQQ